MDAVITKLKKLVNNSKTLVAFSGAGISSESGISTYRGAGGLWSKYNPNVYANINFFLQDSTYYWNFFKDERYPIINKAKPNKAHSCLVELEKKGNLSCVITQNIDGLHQSAGSKNVIELHGTSRKISCMNCKKQYSMKEAYNRLKVEMPPKCSCGGPLKPNTVMFGEPLPQKALKDALNAAKNCDLFLVLGSSLVVYPATQLPIVAKENKAKLVIVNIDPTPLDNIADIIIHDTASSVLSKVVS